MGVGHVPTGPLRQEREGDDLPRREHRGARANVGALGEDIAARFLVDRGAKIVDRNVRLGRGEIDLVVRLDGELVAVEVKAANGEITSIDHFDTAKQQQVRSLASRMRIGRVDFVGVELSANGATVRWLPRVC